MLFNYIKIAWRNLLRFKGNSIINILGLGIGMAVVTLLMLFVTDELNFDGFNVNGDRIMRVVQQKIMSQGVADELSYVPNVTPETFKTEFPEVQGVSRIFAAGQRIVSRGDIRHYENATFSADPDFLKMFSYKLLSGDIETCLTEPNQLVITESFAARYFGEEDPLGQTLQLDNTTDYVVSGILEDPPENTHFTFTALESFVTREAAPMWQYIDRWHTATITYLMLEKPSQKAVIDPKLRELYTTQVPSYDVVDLYLQPVSDIHLHANHVRYDNVQNKSNIDIVYIFASLAVGVLLLACINFMNLATSRSVQRAREVGLRKTAGAGRQQLFGQFMGESIMIALISFPLAVILVEAAIPWFNELGGREIITHIFNRPGIIGLMFGITLAVGILAGIYPALVLSSFKPSKMLSGRIESGSRGAYLRKTLVVGQFTLSILLIIATGLIRQQISFLRNQPLGFDKDHIVVLAMDDQPVKENFEVLRTELEKDHAVLNTTRSMVIPGWWTGFNHIFPQGYTGEKAMIINMNLIDERFIETMGMSVIDGRNFDRERPDDVRKVVINEAALRLFEWDNIEGKTIRQENSDKDMEVIGLVKDYHFSSLHNPVEPQIMINHPRGNSFISIQISSEGVSETLERIESIWKTVNPMYPFDYSFLDEGIASWYTAEERIEKIIGVFTGLAVFIACLGLLGLVSFATQRRTKEIGIRKVLGAGIRQILGLITREFAVLVGIANLIAWPAGYFALQKWMENFAYKAPMNWWLFPLSGLIGLTVVLLTISFNSYKAAVADPVVSLRNQ